MSTFFLTIAFPLTVGVEGGFDRSPNDKGNWTGGAIGVGSLRGTKFGISAASYPLLDIENLTIADAQQIMDRDFYQAVSGDLLPQPLALLTFDSAVNNGVHNAITILQQAVGAPVDGLMGPVTRAAARAAPILPALLEYQSRRTAFMGLQPMWRYDGLGWSRRLFRLYARALLLAAVPVTA